MCSPASTPDDRTVNMKDFKSHSYAKSNVTTHRQKLLFFLSQHKALIVRQGSNQMCSLFFELENICAYTMLPTTSSGTNQHSSAIICLVLLSTTAHQLSPTQNQPCCCKNTVADFISSNPSPSMNSIMQLFNSCPWLDLFPKPNNTLYMHHYEQLPPQITAMPPMRLQFLSEIPYGDATITVGGSYYILHCKSVGDKNYTIYICTIC